MSHEYSTEYVLPNGDMTFDLSKYVQANVDAERERIIKLLEDRNEELIGHISSWFDYGLDHEAGRTNRNKAIALIKGETNE